MESKDERGYLMISIQPDNNIYKMEAHLVSRDEGHSE